MIIPRVVLYYTTLYHCSTTIPTHNHFKDGHTKCCSVLYHLVSLFYHYSYTWSFQIWWYQVLFCIIPPCIIVLPLFLHMIISNMVIPSVVLYYTTLYHCSTTIPTHDHFKYGGTKCCAVLYHLVSLFYHYSYTWSFQIWSYHVLFYIIPPCIIVLPLFLHMIISNMVIPSVVLYYTTLYHCSTTIPTHNHFKYGHTTCCSVLYHLVSLFYHYSYTWSFQIWLYHVLFCIIPPCIIVLPLFLHMIISNMVIPSVVLYYTTLYNCSTTIPTHDHFKYGHTTCCSVSDHLVSLFYHYSYTWSFQIWSYHVLFCIIPLCIIVLPLFLHMIISNMVIPRVVLYYTTLYHCSTTIPTHDHFKYGHYKCCSVLYHLVSLFYHYSYTWSFQIWWYHVLCCIIPQCIIVLPLFLHIIISNMVIPSVVLYYTTLYHCSTTIPTHNNFKYGHTKCCAVLYHLVSLFYHYSYTWSFQIWSYQVLFCIIPPCIIVLPLFLHMIISNMVIPRVVLYYTTLYHCSTTIPTHDHFKYGHYKCCSVLYHNVSLFYHYSYTWSFQIWSYHVLFYIRPPCIIVLPLFLHMIISNRVITNVVLYYTTMYHCSTAIPTHDHFKYGHTTCCSILYHLVSLFYHYSYTWSFQIWSYQVLFCIIPPCIIVLPLFLHMIISNMVITNVVLYYTTLYHCSTTIPTHDHFKYGNTTCCSVLDHLVSLFYHYSYTWSFQIWSYHVLFCIIPPCIIVLPLFLHMIISNMVIPRVVLYYTTLYHCSTTIPTHDHFKYGNTTCCSVLDHLVSLFYHYSYTWSFQIW